MNASRLPGPTYPFSPQELYDANRTWGCNCGPAALAVMLNLKPAAVRSLVPDFEGKGYTNPTMMRSALFAAGARISTADDQQPLTRYGICRIQWEGPWTQPGASPRWAYAYTHWIGALVFDQSPAERQWVYDVNAGWQTLDVWTQTTVPLITAWYKRATGGWHATHRWEIFLGK